MISPKKLIKMAQKWQNTAAKGRNPKPWLPEKGHFVVYSTDRKRFMIPLEYINCEIFRELFRMSEEEFGLPSNSPLMMPCDSVVMEYVVSLVQRGASKCLGRALLNSISTGQCLLSVSCQESKSHGLPVFAYWDNVEQCNSISGSCRSVYKAFNVWYGSWWYDLSLISDIHRVYGLGNLSKVWEIKT